MPLAQQPGAFGAIGSFISHNIQLAIIPFQPTQPLGMTKIIWHAHTSTNSRLPIVSQPLHEAMPQLVSWLDDLGLQLSVTVKQ